MLEGPTLPPRNEGTVPAPPPTGAAPGDHSTLARVTYNLEWAVPLVVDEQGEVVREAAFRLQIERGRRVRFAIALLRHLFEHSVELAEVYPTGTRFTPIGSDGEQLKVLVETPQGVDTVARIARAS